VSGPNWKSGASTTRGRGAWGEGQGPRDQFRKINLIKGRGESRSLTKDEGCNEKCPEKTVGSIKGGGKTGPKKPCKGGTTKKTKK